MFPVRPCSVIYISYILNKIKKIVEILTCCGLKLIHNPRIGEKMNGPLCGLVLGCVKLLFLTTIERNQLCVAGNVLTMALTTNNFIQLNINYKPGHNQDLKTNASPSSIRASLELRGDESGKRKPPINN